LAFYVDSGDLFVVICLITFFNFFLFLIHPDYSFFSLYSSQFLVSSPTNWIYSLSVSLENEKTSKRV
ncbi:hypothetical protein ACQP3J_27870, partial [Escherichia coli]